MPDDKDPASVVTMLGNSGAFPEIPLDGKVWKIGHPTQRAKAVLESLAIQKATDEVLSKEGVLPPAAFERVWESFTDKIAGGDFKTWRKGWRKAVFGPPETLFLLSILRENHPEATEKDALKIMIQKPRQLQVAYMEVVPGFLSLLME